MNQGQSEQTNSCKNSFFKTPYQDYFDRSLNLNSLKSINLSFVANIGRFEEWTFNLAVSQFGACDEERTNQNAQKHGASGRQSRKNGSFDASFSRIFFCRKKFSEIEKIKWNEWNLREVNRSLTVGSSSSCSTRIDWNKLMLSDKVLFTGSDGTSLFVTPLRFLQWQGWLWKKNKKK